MHLVDTKRLIHAYVKIRDKRSELKKEFETVDNDLKAKMARLGMELLRIMQERGESQIKNAEGTAFKRMDTKYSCEDWDGFYAWMYEQQQAEMLTRSLKQSTVDAYFHEVKQLPPGVRMHEEITVCVHRPKDKPKENFDEEQ